MRLSQKNIIGTFENWKTIGPIASVYTGAKKATELEKLFLLKKLEKGILLSPKALEEVQEEEKNKEFNLKKQDVILRTMVSFYGYVQERAFRATVQGFAKSLNIIVESIENDKDNKEKVIAILKGRDDSIHNLIQILKKPHIVAHSRKGDDKFDFGEHIYIMAFSERNIIQNLEVGFQFINMVTHSKIHEEVL